MAIGKIRNAWGRGPYYTGPRPPYLIALDVIARSLGLILPALVALLAEIILGLVGGAIGAVVTPFVGPLGSLGVSSFFDLLSEVIVVIAIFVTAFEVGSVMAGGTADLRRAWQITTSNTTYLAPVAAILGVLDFLLAFGRVPGGTFIVGLANVIAFLSAGFISNGTSPGVGRVLTWYADYFSLDGVSALILLVVSLVSLVPILDLLTLPYGTALAVAMVRRMP
jgi:hypothetical protein